MMKLQTKLPIITIAILLLLPNALSVNAKPRRNANPVNAQPAAKPNDPYAKAKKDLSEDWYVLYRIVDRIARANGLDERPWRINISPEYQINAFATDVNLIAVYNGLLDQLGSDSSAIACVVGHEMAHHTKRHIALGEAEQLALTEKFQKEAEIQVKEERQNAQQDIAGNQVGSGIVRALGGFFGVDTTPVANLTEQMAQKRAAEAEKRVQEIVAQKKKELEEQSAANNRKQEFEADQVGYRYIATAGFDPKGCLRVMEVLGRTPGSEADGSHPAVPKRIDQLNQLMAENPPSTLADQGKLYLSTRKNPLTYELSKDGKSLRINSHKGNSAGTDIERQFGQ